MEITVLAENTTRRPDLITEHGLGLHIRWAGGPLMMDFGQKGAIVPNAEALGIDLTAPVLGVLSHGHFDHSGGLAAFREKNPAMPVYIQREAMGPHWAARLDGSYEYIGMDPALAGDDLLRPVTGVTELGHGALLFDGITGRRFYSRANDCLLVKTPSSYEPDAFRHEQALLLPHGSGYVLFGGCAHNGIANAIDRAMEIWGKAPDAVLSGFHLADPTSQRGYDPDLTEALAKALRALPTRYYTCHCTGLAAYEVLKTAMGDQVDYAACGDVIQL